MAKSTSNKQTLTSKQQADLLDILATRFTKHMQRHKGVNWSDVQAKLLTKPSKLWSLNEMELSGGEPDVIHTEKTTTEFLFMDCSAESPAARRSLCFDLEAWQARKENKPKGNATDMAKAMGIEMLSEEQYRLLQSFGNFDTKTSSWIQTPANIRQLGGALFCDRRYNTVFVYHNGAESYYAARGFRGFLLV
jgi:hypothetical protein